LPRPRAKLDSYAVFSYHFSTAMSVEFHDFLIDI
jgi:hypothetical protein